jgi:hypothetical protein
VIREGRTMVMSEPLSNIYALRLSQWQNSIKFTSLSMQPVATDWLVIEPANIQLHPNDFNTVGGFMLAEYEAFWQICWYKPGSCPMGIKAMYSKLQTPPTNLIGFGSTMSSGLLHTHNLGTLGVKSYQKLGDEDGVRDEGSRFQQLWYLSTKLQGFSSSEDCNLNLYPIRMSI